MANDRIQVKITADDKQFTSTMQRVQKSAKGAQSGMSALGGALSGIGPLMGGVGSQAGAAGSALANLASVFITLGPAGVAVGGLVAGLALAYSEFVKQREATKAAKDELKALTRELDGFKYDGGQFGKFAKELDDAQLRATKLRKELAALQRERVAPGSAFDDATRKAAKGGLLPTMPSPDLKTREEVLKEESKVKADLLVMTIEGAQWATKDNKAIADRNALAKKGAAEQAKADKEKADRARKFREERKKEEHEYRLWVEANERGYEDDTRKAAEAEFAWKVEFSENLAVAEWELEKGISDEREAEHQRVMARLDEEKAMRDKMVAEEQQASRERTEAITDEAITLAVFSAQTLLDQRASDAEKFEAMVGYFSAMAINTGSIMAIEGAGMLAAGQLQGGGKLAAGLALLGLGAGGMAGAESVSAAVFGGGSSDGPDTGSTAATTRAPTTNIGPGTTGGDQQTIVNYYFGGPVFGNQDDAARAVSSMNERGRRLDGLR